ncbi:MAG: hypothetical protein LUF92_03730 [Clostridiales bacterium]|nr:hypothetical protein [Clostridiales bacterium]
MQINNKVTNIFFTQWIEGFVSEVLNRTELECKEVTIEDVDDKRIYLTIDGVEYDIRTWNYHPIGHDKNGEVNAEGVEYTLFNMSGNSGQTVPHGSGVTKITWDNAVVRQNAKNN